MKNKKILFWVIIIALIYAAFVLVISKAFGKDDDNLGKDNNENKIPEIIDYDYLVVGDISLWGFHKGSWYNLAKDNIDDELLKVYIDKNYIGNYKLRYVNSWNLFDNNNNYVNYNGDILAFSNNLNIDIINYNYIDIIDDDILEASKLLGIDILIDELSINEKIVLDLDNNGIQDKIVTISNINDSVVYERYFNLVYIVLNGEEKVLINEQIEPKDMYLSPIYSLVNILNIDDNRNIIINKRYFSNSGESQNLMYQYKNGRYVEVVK